MIPDPRKIETGLAVAMAGQISTGLTPGDQQAQRSLGALQTLALMLLQSVKDDVKTWELVSDVLAMSSRSTIHIDPDGSTVIRPND